MKQLWIVAVLLGVFLNGCNAIDLPIRDPPSDCPDDLQVESIVRPSNVDLLPGDTQQISYRVFTVNCDEQREVAVDPVWESANPAIATVSDSGLITARQRGNTEITVAEEEYDTRATVDVSVEPAP